ncbi:MAG: roadblock/LC7 domain-containing protein [Chthoniobacteraceae bacterium]|jgi:predicted regulator of Ras-like GTPase activity (Roadblock/LC7/MglB family)
MFSLPLLISEDIAAIDAALMELVATSNSRLALVMDGGGFILTQKGDAADMDTATLGALAANSFAATQAIAHIIEDQSVTSLYQQGVVNSFLILAVADFGFLAVVFPASIGVGSVKFFAEGTAARIARQLDAAHSRAPAEGLDLAALNLSDAAPLFQRRL